MPNQQRQSIDGENYKRKLKLNQTSN